MNSNKFTWHAFIECQNNCSTFVTGIGASAQDDTASADVCTTNTYETTNVQTASTAGNITGVYDMSGGICYGHALSETLDWYGDFAFFVSSTNSWFIRGAIAALVRLWVCSCFTLALATPAIRFVSFLPRLVELKNM